MSPLEQITQDLNWRETELGSLKLLMARRDISPAQREVLLRASWALLYAHYEGFVKTALTVFFDCARKCGNSCRTLPAPTRLFALEKALKLTRSLPPEEFLSEIEEFAAKHYDAAPKFPDVNTQSNLWPNVLSDLLAAADLNVVALNEHRIKLKTLVARRNEIAHGKQEQIQEMEYYASFESAVYDLMYELAFSIDARLKQPPYA